MKRWIVILSLICTPAFGIIKVQLPVSDLYKASQNVSIGTVTKVNRELGNIEATAKAAKGAGVGEVLRFKVELPEVLKTVKEGSPLVIFTGRRAAAYALHLADTWLLPEPFGEGNALFAVRQEKDLRQSFPGSTTALVGVVEGLAAGKYSMLNSVSPNMFKGEMKEIGKIEVGGQMPLLLTVRTKDAQAIVAVKQNEKRFYAIKEGRMVSANPVDVPAFQVNTTDEHPTARLLHGNFGEHDRPSTLIVSPAGIFHRADASSAHDDFLRLTGERLATYFKGELPLKDATCSALDCNGDGRMDVMIHTPVTGPVLLINRGYGAFFVNAELHKIIKSETLGPTVRWTAADVDGDGLDDLIVVAENGTVTAIMNPKPTE